MAKAHHTRRHLSRPAVLTDTHKDCTYCGEVKPLSEFHLSKGNRGGRHTWCKECRKLHKPDAAAARRTHLRWKYGLSERDVEAMFVSQGGCCPACGDSLARDRFTHVDHCHETGVVRGLLCHNCNTALGLLKESPRRINGLLAYLRLHEGREAVHD